MAGTWPGQKISLERASGKASKTSCFCLYDLPVPFVFDRAALSHSPNLTDPKTIHDAMGPPTPTNHTVMCLPSPTHPSPSRGGRGGGHFEPDGRPRIAVAATLTRGTSLEGTASQRPNITESDAATARAERVAALAAKLSEEIKCRELAASWNLARSPRAYREGQDRSPRAYREGQNRSPRAYREGQPIKPRSHAMKEHATAARADADAIGPTLKDKAMIKNKMTIKDKLEARAAAVAMSEQKKPGTAALAAAVAAAAGRRAEYMATKRDVAAAMSGGSCQGKSARLAAAAASAHLAILSRHEGSRPRHERAWARASAARAAVAKKARETRPAITTLLRVDPLLGKTTTAVTDATPLPPVPSAAALSATAGFPYFSSTFNTPPQAQSIAARHFIAGFPYFSSPLTTRASASTEEVPISPKFERVATIIDGIFADSLSLAAVWPPPPLFGTVGVELPLPPQSQDSASSVVAAPPPLSSPSPDLGNNAALRTLPPRRRVRAHRPRANTPLATTPPSQSRPALGDITNRSP